MKIEDIFRQINYSINKNKCLVLPSESTQVLLEYIADLQRKEYNNSKAIEYIKECTSSPDKYERFISTGESKMLLNILEKEE